MALKPLNPKHEPYGVFDGLDAEVTAFKGGEVVAFTYVAKGSSVDKGAADLNDGYVSDTSQTRPAVTKTLVSGVRPLFLADEGVSGYGTLFGVVVGGTAGQQVGGSTLGPHTAYASGKVTLWDGPGLYAVTLDAVDTTAATGLTKTNTTLAGNAALYATSAGLLTPNSSASFEVGGPVVGRFIEFTTNGSFVTTPSDLVTGAANFTQAVIRFKVED
jgi:hypothetical protein